MKQNREELIQIIEQLYSEPTDKAEIINACDNFINFFNELINIDQNKKGSVKDD
jgi:hypothetical protein